MHLTDPDRISILAELLL